MAEVRGISNACGATGPKVVAIVGAVRQVEGLRKQLQVHAFPELDVLRQAHVELKERIATQGIVLSYRASLRHAVYAIEAVLCPRVVACEREIVCRIVGWNYHGSARTATGVQRVGGVGQVVRARRTKLQDWRELEALGQVDNAAHGYVVAFVVG